MRVILTILIIIIIVRYNNSKHPLQYWICVCVCSWLVVRMLAPQIINRVRQLVINQWGIRISFFQEWSAKVQTNIIITNRLFFLIKMWNYNSLLFSLNNFLNYLLMNHILLYMNHITFKILRVILLIMMVVQKVLS